LIYLFQNRIYDSFDAYRAVLRRNPPDETYLGGINDLREVLRDHPGKHPFAYLMLGMLALKSGEYTMAQDALSRFTASGNIGDHWRGMAQRMLRTMDIGEAER
jgi:cytochrome c-type biogenesis protein CcmH/NrfG